MTAPQGRLTLTTGVPVMTSDVTGATSVFYTPYVGAQIPIYNGTSFVMTTFSQLTMALDATNQISGSVHDLFVWNNAGTVSIGAGPAWSTATTRGTGAGSTQISLVNGFWVNAVAITLTNGAGAGTSVAINQASYIGTIYATGNGQTGMAFTPAAAGGGTNNVLGVCNAYNRVPILATSRDNTASWTYTSTTLRPANNSSSNRISWVDGLQQSGVSSEYNVLTYANSTSMSSVIGIGLDSTAALNSVGAQFNYAAATPLVGAQLSSTSIIPPLLGFHFVQALESASSGTTATFQGSRATPTAQTQYLRITLEM